MRYRRYRVFVAFVVIALFALYRFGSSSVSWREASRDIGLSKGADDEPAPWRARPQVAQETKQLNLDVPIVHAAQSLQRPPALPPVSRPVDTPTPETTDDANPTSTDSDALVPSSTSAIHWSKHAELYPVPASKIIKLPSGKPKAIPRIQHQFEKESPAAKADRERKLNVIKGVFKRSWDGYREYAWLQDELSPVSGKFRNPFAGWGATLVDALDTLWIMGLKEEFDEAAKAVDHIDFTTTPNARIPMFETTIRYLGGLLAAYDLSERKYPNLLKKAVELAELLMSAFDTPNRMPITYYYWSPAFADEPGVASERVVLAEIGSLSVEFTRLAQLTGEHKYYDAIARITDNFEEFQKKTRLPGMWPTHFDASGCKEVVEESTSTVPEVPTGLSPNGKKYIPLNKPPPVVFLAEPATDTPSPVVLPPEVVVSKVEKTAAPIDTKIMDSHPKLAARKVDDHEILSLDESGSAKNSDHKTSVPLPKRPVFEKDPLTCGFNASQYGNDEYTLGGESDSTYEYLPKQWLLLGGQIDKYRTMYEASMDVVKDHLIFRPMLPNDTDVLFSGKLIVPPKGSEGNAVLDAENAHLTCFAGGMFAMGAKIFNRPDDLELATKLTEGCIWSYDMTATGIMPEAFISVPCESTKHCEWNETKYWEGIDPGAEGRKTSYRTQLKNYKEQMVSASAWYEAEMASYTAGPKKTGTAAQPLEAIATPTAATAHVDSSSSSNLKEKRQFEPLEPETEDNPAINDKTVPGWRAPQRLAVPKEPKIAIDHPEPPTPVQAEAEAEPDYTAEPSPTMPEFPYIYSPTPPLSHEEYVTNRIKNERLPLGVTDVRARSYILR